MNEWYHYALLIVVGFAVGLIIVFKPKMKMIEVQGQLSGKYLWLSIVFAIYEGFINAELGF
ncbi:MAG: hypothetical protein ABJN84_03445 [Flavobacteriaceae bacterium]